MVRCSRSRIDCNGPSLSCRPVVWLERVLLWDSACVRDLSAHVEQAAWIMWRERASAIWLVTPGRCFRNIFFAAKKNRVRQSNVFCFLIARHGLWLLVQLISAPSSWHNSNSGALYKFGMGEWLNGPIIFLAVSSLLSSLSMIFGCWKVDVRFLEMH